MTKRDTLIITPRVYLVTIKDEIFHVFLHLKVVDKNPNNIQPLFF